MSLLEELNRALPISSFFEEDSKIHMGPERFGKVLQIHPQEHFCRFDLTGLHKVTSDRPESPLAEIVPGASVVFFAKLLVLCQSRVPASCCHRFQHYLHQRLGSRVAAMTCLASYFK